MTKPKPTPGPWKVGQCWDHIPIWADEPRAGRIGDTAVARVPSSGTEWDRARAGCNARLIAAAPDMYDALARCVSEFYSLAEYLDQRGVTGTWQATHEKAKAALALAKAP